MRRHQFIDVDYDPDPELFDLVSWDLPGRAARFPLASPARPGLSDFHPHRSRARRAVPVTLG